MAPHVLNCPWGCTLPWKLWSRSVAPTPRPRLGLSLVLAVQGMGVSPAGLSSTVLGVFTRAEPSRSLAHCFGGLRVSETPGRCGGLSGTALGILGANGRQGLGTVGIWWKAPLRAGWA